MSYLTVHEVASQLRVSDLTVRRWIWNGKLPAVRVGRMVRIRQTDVDSLTREKSRQAKEAAAPPRRGSPAAMLTAIREISAYVKPEDVDELERLIEEGCERPGDIRTRFD